MNKVVGIFIASLFSASFGSAVLAESGTVHWHTGFHETATVVNVAEGHVQGHASGTGITFNDAGSGPLHEAAGNCFYAFDMADGVGEIMGFCTWGDTDGDRIFTKFDGVLGAPEGANGTNYITGGTGKYVGITGKGPWACTYPGTNSELRCNQSLDYELP